MELLPKGDHWPWRDLARCAGDPEHTPSILRVLAAGFAGSLCAWEMAHGALLEDYLLKNELAAPARQSLLHWLAGGALATLLAWAFAVILIAGARQTCLPTVLRRSSNLLFCAVLLPIIPILALTHIDVTQPVLDLSLVTGLALLALVHGQLIASDWALHGASGRPLGNGRREPGPLSGWPAEARAPQTGEAPQTPEAGSTPGAIQLEGVSLGPEFGEPRPPACSLHSASPSKQRQDAPFAGFALRALRGASHLRAPDGQEGLLIVALLAAGYALFFSLFTVAKHNAFGTHSFDLGIFDQGLYTILHNGVMLSTQHGAATIYHFGRHFSPFLYLLAPFYGLAEDARTLLVIQSIFLGIGAVPVYLLARRKTGSELVGILLAASYLLYPALQGVNNFDFSEIALAPPLLLFSLYFLETGHDRWFAFFLILAAATKEEVAMSGAAIGAYIFLVKKRPRQGILVAAASLAYFALVNEILMPALGHGPLVDIFTGVMPAGGSGFGAILTTMATNPVFVFQYIFFNPGRLIFLWEMLLPLAFLPLLAWQAWYITLPALAVPLLSDISAHYQIGYQYPATSIPFFFFLAILGLEKLQQRRWNVQAAVVAVLLASLVMNYQLGLLFSKSFAGMPRPNAHQLVVNGFVNAVPRDASISTTSDIVPHVSHREKVYLFPIVNDADYILFDSDASANFWPYVGLNSRARAVQTLAPYLASGEYGVVREQDGCLLLSRGAGTSQDMAALKDIFSEKFAAGDMRGDLGVDVPDASAGTGLARVGRPGDVTANGKRALTYGPYDALLPGRYRVTYRMKVDADRGPGKLATLDAFSNSAGGALHAMDVSASDFAAPGTYQDFGFDFDVHAALGDVEYRVLYDGPATLFVDDIQVTPLNLEIPAGSVHAPGMSVASAPALDEDLEVGAEPEGDAAGPQENASPSAGVAVTQAEPLAYVPRTRLPAGTYKAYFTLKLPAEGTVGPVARLAVFLAGANREYAWRDVSAADFPGQGQYGLFDVDIQTPAALDDVEYRVVGETQGLVAGATVSVAQWVGFR